MRGPGKAWLVGAGVVVSVLGIGLLVQVPFFYYRSHTRGQQLLNKVNNELTHNTTTRGAAAPPFQSVVDAKAGALIGEVVVPTLRLQAPMLQGTEDPELSIGAGHLVTSVMPGDNGTSVIAAHNATWFRHIDRLQTGDLIQIRTLAGEFQFRVSGHKVVRTGAPVYNTARPSVVLEACYPLNALYLTPYRYLVFATWAGGSGGSAVAAGGQANDLSTGSVTVPNIGAGLVSSAVKSGASVYSAVIPDALSKQGLTLATNVLPMGTLTYQGKPDFEYTESADPLDAANTLVTLYLAWLHASADQRPGWLADLWPGLNGASVSSNPFYGLSLDAYSYLSLFNVRLDVSGRQLLSATGSVRVRVAGRGEYVVQMMATAVGKTLRVESIHFAPAAG